MGDSGRDDSHAKELSRASIAKFFIVGGLLLVTPMVFVFNWPSQGCNTSFENFCSGSQFYRTSVTILPYVMVIGGVIIGYNMKRISDSINTKDSHEEEEEESNDPGDGDISTST